MRSNAYTLIFTSITTVILGFLLSFVYSSLEETQRINEEIDIMKNILYSLEFKENDDPWTVEEVKKFIDLPSLPPRSPGPFAFMENDYVNSILEDSDFGSIEIEGHEAEVNMFPGRSLSDSVKDYSSINPVVTKMLKDSSNEIKERILNSVSEAFFPYFSEKGLIFPSSTWLVRANKKK